MDLHKKRGNKQPQSLFQFMASNFSTRLGLFAGFFHCSCSQSGHCSLPVGFLSHSLLSRACLAPSVSGTTCTTQFETMFQHFNQGSYLRDKLMTCAPLCLAWGWQGPRAGAALEGVSGLFNFFAGGFKEGSAAAFGEVRLLAPGVFTLPPSLWALNMASSACASLRRFSNSAWVRN
jgi:hypothetical protein